MIYLSHKVINKSHMEVTNMKSKAEKKIVTLEKYYKVKLIGSACGFALALILAISNGILGTDTPFWFLPLVGLLAIPFFVCFVMIMILH